MIKEKGIEITDPQTQIDDSVLEKKHRELQELKQFVQEAQFDATVAHAATTAVVAGNGDLRHAEEMALMDTDNSSGDDSTIRKGNKSRTSQQVTIITSIEEKEKIVLQRN